jgi:hypothetical protein
MIKPIVKQLALLIVVFSSLSSVHSQTGPVDALIHPGCGTGPGHYLTDPESRFLNLYSKVFARLTDEYHKKKLGLTPGPEFMKQQLKTEFKGKEFCCEVKLTPEGAISDLRVSKTSGFAELDKRAMEIIQDSAPFLAVKADGTKTYHVNFPTLVVQQITN